MRPLELLFVAAVDEHAKVEPLVAGLRRAGHRVALELGADEVLGRPTPDVLVVTEAAGLELLAAFEAGEHTPWRIALCGERDFELAAAALRAGAEDLLVNPTIAELVAAVQPRPASSLRIHTPRSATETYLVGPGMPACEARPVLDLLAFTTRLGLERAWRTRIATAVGLAVENARSHAYPEAEGPLEMVVELTGQTLTVTLADQGVGFEPAAPDALGALDALRGLDLIDALTERLDVTSGPDGTTLQLEFELTPVRFEEEAPGLDELDHMDPASCRELMALATSGDLEVPAHLMPTLGRLLSARQRSGDPVSCLFV